MRSNAALGTMVRRSPSSRYCLAHCATAGAYEEVRLSCLANRMVTSGGWGADRWVAASIAAFPVAPIPDARDEDHASDHGDDDIAQQLPRDEDRRDSAKDDGHDDQAGEGRHELTVISPVMITPFTTAAPLLPPEPFKRALADGGHETAKPIPKWPSMQKCLPPAHNQSVTTCLCFRYIQ